MSYISTSKWGICCICGGAEQNVVKIKRDLFCLSCNQRMKAEEQIRKQKARNAERQASTKLRTLATDSPEAKAPKEYRSKSQLLKDADRLFGDFIKRRDTDKNGMVYCPCCKGKFNATDMQFGTPVINCMHFIDRDVYSLRYDEDAAHAGHAWCNKNQHYEPSGKEYQKFKSFLEDKFGIHAVHEMELQKRKINKISEQDLKYVIEYYSQLKTGQP